MTTRFGWVLGLALLGSVHAREVNLSYLNSLLTPITVEGKAYTGLAIYADPDPKTPGQYLLKDAPGEGFVDLDDVARAVVVYARDGSPESLKHARDLLEIVLLLQTPDGEFYNFITREGRVNTDGQTSFKSAGFWAARAVWGIAEALPAFEKTDPAFAARLQASLDRAVTAFARNVDAKYSQFRDVDGVKAPTWLPMDGSDVGSILVVGLSTYLKTHPQDKAAAQLAGRVAEGIAAFAPGDTATYPFGLPLPDTKSRVGWHAWGARQVQALALAGKVLNRPEFIEVARKAAHPLIQLLISDGPIEKLTPAPTLYPQIAYGMEAIASSFFALSDATGEDVWNELGGLTTAWLFGLNNQHLPLYDAATGRTYDGLEQGFVNVSAGAESNVTALLALQQAEARPSAAQYLHAQEVERRADILLEAENGQDFGSPPTARSFADASGRKLAVLSGGGSLTLKGPQAGTYSAQLLALGRPAAATLRLDASGQNKTVTLAASPEGLRAYPLGTLKLPPGAPIALTQTAGGDALPDAVWLFPELEAKQVAAGKTRTLLLKSWSDQAQSAGSLPAGASLRIYRMTGQRAEGDQIPPYGFALAQWSGEVYSGPETSTAQQVSLSAAQTIGKNELLDLAPVFNGDAFSTSSDPRRGNLDNPGGAAGATLPAERAPKAGPLTVAGVQLLFPDPLTRPNVYTPSQALRFNLPPGPATALHLLITADHGAAQTSLTLHFSEGEPLSAALNVSDWCQSPQFGETVVAAFNARRISNGTLESLNCNLYAVTLAVPAGRTLTAVTWPSRPTLHLFGLTIERP
ncbi:hypothetical protein [Deinococcus alpinitundrae]|uniref:hypothetical protein n=1 Tax=Deinococcus alpinitundrae TaxID=468913 RepID=UPI00137993A4|nr:hypothetical protein [Deinococcus alpinitundrae]